MPRKHRSDKPASPQPPEPRDGFIAVGWVLSAHGTCGELSVRPLTDFPQRFQPGATVWASGRPHIVRHTRPHRGALLLELEGVETRDQAETLRNLLLEVPQEEVPPLAERQYFRFEVLGMNVVDLDGRLLGTIVQVLDTGADDVYVVQSAEGELLLPAIDTVVKDVDVEAQRMIVELIEGLEHRPNARPRKQR